MLACLYMCVFLRLKEHGLQITPFKPASPTSVDSLKKHLHMKSAALLNALTHFWHRSQQREQRYYASALMHIV